MPVQINQPIENDFSNPLGLLTDCHRRIERFLNVLWTISGKFQGEPLDAELVNLLEDLVRTYAEHISLEERKVFPLAATLLNITDLDDIAVEMANRRGLVFSRHGAHS